jgi:hypothetical protein
MLRCHHKLELVVEVDLNKANAWIKSFNVDLYFPGSRLRFA